jgi:hypothetical protein
MKIIVDLSILFEEHGINHLYTHVGKMYETALVPMVGMKIIDSVWEEAREIKSVIIDPDNGSYLLNVGDDTCMDKAECEQRKLVYHSRGWMRFLVQTPVGEILEVRSKK